VTYDHVTAAAQSIVDSAAAKIEAEDDAQRRLDEMLDSGAPAHVDPRLIERARELRAEFGPFSKRNEGAKWYCTMALERVVRNHEPC